MSLELDEHRQYLSDQARISAFARAITEVVKPGDVVVDLGSGTGILGLLACRAGAGRVYSIDMGGMIELAREIGRVNGFEDRMIFIKGLSTRVDLPEKVDVVVADQIGRFGFEAGVVEYFKDARERFLKPGGVLIPGRIDLEIAPVERPDLWATIDFWSQAPAGFDYGPARTIAANTGYPTRYKREHLLGDPVLGAELKLGAAEPGFVKWDVTVPVRRSGTLHGIGGWFTAHLSKSALMSNGPLAECPIDRRCTFFPIDRPLPVREGDSVAIDVRLLLQDAVVSWKVEVRDKSGEPRARFSHSTLRGTLITREDLQSTKPESVPALTPWGEARRSVIDLCDGKRSLAEIEREVFSRHRMLFRSSGHAAAFVVEVVTRYAR